jgi:hypothetical protein
MIHALRKLLFAAALAFCLAPPARAQDSNITFPISEIEQKLKNDSLDIEDMRGSRWESDRTNRVVLQFLDSTLMMVKWAKAAAGGETFNNVPRYEVGAYELQKLFLDEPDYVVPPTIMRALPLAYYRTLDPRIKSTFGGKTDGVLVVLQYWLFGVTPQDVFDEARARTDDRYAAHLANANIFSYLVRHSDSNQGNFLISTDSTNPRIFAVDNGVAFASMAGDRGTDWQALRVKRIPASTVERLKAITKDDLERALGVLAEFEIQEGRLVAVPPTDNLDRKRGVRRDETRIQLGLKESEINDVYGRLQRLLQMVERGSIKTF